ncbi:MAG: hypothetical protein J6S63_01430 [Atopobiaceae bacterium]|nr:hypothetical protein [Atopobiaceae bacterium]
MELDLYTRILDLGEENRAHAEHMREAGYKAARYDRDYKMLRAKKEIELRALGHPASMVKDLAEGDEEVSLAKLQSNLAEADADSDKEIINNNKKIMDTLKSQMEFERVGRNMTEGFYEY